MRHSYKTLFYLLHPLGFTPLHLAIVKQRNDSARLLIAELGLKSVGAVNESGVTAAHVAASAGQCSARSDQCPVMCTNNDKDQRTFNHYCPTGNVDVLKIILQKHKKVLHQEAGDGERHRTHCAMNNGCSMQYI